MIKKEYFGTRKDGASLYRVYSDCGLRLRQIETGEVYDEAIDIDHAPYTYTETTEVIGSDSEREVS